MEIIRLTEVDADVNYIVEFMIDRDEEGPSLSHLKVFLNDDRSYLLTAKINNLVIGYAFAYRFPSLYGSAFMAYLYDIEVSETYRRQGVGRAMIKVLLGLLNKDNVSELYLGTATDNVEGQALFSKTGGVRSGETFNDFTYYL